MSPSRTMSFAVLDCVSPLWGWLVSINNSYEIENSLAYIIYGKSIALTCWHFLLKIRCRWLIWRKKERELLKWYSRSIILFREAWWQLSKFFLDISSKITFFIYYKVCNWSRASLARPGDLSGNWNCNFIYLRISFKM